MMTREEYELEEGIKRWNMIAIALFVLLAYLTYVHLERYELAAFRIPIFDFFVLGLATLRLIRLITYDNITLFAREWLKDVKIVKYAEEGEEHIERVSSRNSFKRTLERLINCPWCVGVWVSLGIVFFYVTVPESYGFFIVLAVASLASLFQIVSNGLGWNAEYQKVQVAKLEKE